MLETPARATTSSRSLVRPFRVSHTEVTEVTEVGLELTAGDWRGVGSVPLGPWRSEDPAAVAGRATELAATVQPALGESMPADAVAALSVLLQPVQQTAPSAAYLTEMAALDLLCSRFDLPLWQLLNLPEPAASLATLHTLSLGEALPDEARSQPLKIKLGGPDDEAILDDLLARGASALLDVNRGWTRDDVVRLLPRLRHLPLIALEDPVQDRADLALLREHLEVAPVMLDEGIDSPAAVTEGLLIADGLNLKLLKLGGLLPAIEAAHEARHWQKRVMLGCFIEPAVNIGYAATMSGLADWCDLDGHTWLEEGWSLTRVDLDSSRPGATRLVHG